MSTELSAQLAALPDAGTWTPSRVINLARASEIEALVALVNALPALLSRLERAEDALRAIRDSDDTDLGRYAKFAERIARAALPGNAPTKGRA